MADDNRIYDSRQVANHILGLASQRQVTLVPAQLVKLVYVCHGWALGLLHRPLIVEDVEARRDGPAIRRLHDALGEQSLPITQPVDAPAGAPFNAEEADVMQQVFEVYGAFTPVRLSTLTLTRGTPWDITWRRHGDGAVIPKDLIEAHFAGLARRSDNRVAASVPE